jgi:hypothetical protein
MGRKLPIDETSQCNGIIHRPYGKSLSKRLLDALFRRFLDDACTNKAAPGVMALKKQDLSIDTNFEHFCENWIDPITYTLMDVAEPEREAATTQRPRNI